MGLIGGGGWQVFAREAKLFQTGPLSHYGFIEEFYRFPDHQGAPELWREIRGAAAAETELILWGEVQTANAL